MQIFRSLISTIISFISVTLFPLILTAKYPYHYDQSTLISLVMVFSIILYINFFIPLHPNKYFNIVYLIIMTLLVYQNYRIIFSIQLVILFFCQLFIAFIANRFEKIQNLLCLFVIPIFTTVLLIYSLFHFIAPSNIIITILINFLVLLLQINKTIKEQLLALISIIIILIALYLLKYLSMITAVSYLLIYLANLLISKYLSNRFQSDKNSIFRIIFSLLNLIS